MERRDMDKRVQEWIKSIALPSAIAIAVSIGDGFRQASELKSQVEELRLERDALIRHDSGGFLHPGMDAACTAHARRVTSHLLTREEFNRYVGETARYRKQVKQLNPSLVLPEGD